MASQKSKRELEQTEEGRAHHRDDQNQKVKQVAEEDQVVVRSTLHNALE